MPDISRNRDKNKDVSFSEYDRLKYRYYDCRDRVITTRFGEDDFYQRLKQNFFGSEDTELYRELFRDTVAFAFRYIVYGIRSKKTEDENAPTGGMFIPGQFVDDAVHETVCHVFSKGIPYFLQSPRYDEHTSPDFRRAFLLVTIQNKLRSYYTKLWNSSGRILIPIGETGESNAGCEPGNGEKPPKEKYFIPGSLEDMWEKGTEPRAESTAPDPASGKAESALKTLFALPCSKPENLLACCWVITDNMEREMRDEDTHANSKTADAARHLNGITAEQALNEIRHRLISLGIPVNILEPLRERITDMEYTFNYGAGGAQTLSKQLFKFRLRLVTETKNTDDE